MQAISGDPEIKSVAERRQKAIVATCAVLLLLAAGWGWLSYLAQASAYGAIYGLRGREGDLIELAFGARVALLIALICEGLAIGSIFRLILAPVEPRWGRLPASILLALLVDFATFVTVRALA